jgi:hypothetical protein
LLDELVRQVVEIHANVSKFQAPRGGVNSA